MPDAPDPHDPKGLIRESYRIPGITVGECRSIFVDWALSLPVGADTGAAMAALIARHGDGDGRDDHPMTRVLRDGLAGTAGPPARRGGHAGRTRA